MLLWTEQSSLAWQRLQTRGVLHADGRRALDPTIFREGYRWMAGQLRGRVGPPPRGVKYPVWAWDRRTRAVPRRWTRSPGENVAIVFDIPPKDVLLSDFDSWHCVLCHGYIGETDEDDERFDEEFEPRLGSGVRAWDLREARTRIQQSWPRIFELNRLQQLHGHKWWVQAVFWELRLDQVRRVIPLERRPPTAHEERSRKAYLRERRRYLRARRSQPTSRPR